MSAPRTVTLATVDHGDVTLTCPAWCNGHAGHRPDTYRADITHNAAQVDLTHRGRTVGLAVISQSPFAERSTRDIRASVVLSFESGPGGFDAVVLYDLAAELDGHADTLRAVADQLDTLTAGGGQ
ncbi:DUF6907 domain-containing protein [Streptomyces sp. NPDC005227]|uniref:DUF6907 domain-containing protein n=1 Tax=Streptomyces sp. NPDC005227 TaxID=3364707 RepID=UPI0036C84863